MGGQRRSWTRRWVCELEDGPAGQGRVELDQLMSDLSAILVQTGGSVVISAHRVQVSEHEYETTHVFAEFDAYSPGLNLTGPDEDEPADDPELDPVEQDEDESLGIHEPETADVAG